MTATSRAQVDKAIKRLDKALDDARDALGSLGKDVTHGRPYKDLSKTLTGLRSDAGKANRKLTKELDKLRAAATPGRSSSTRRSSSSTTARKASSTARKASSTARKASGTAKSGARKATASRSRSSASRSRS